jgi:hypothetical protein
MDASELWFFLSFQGMVDSFGEGEIKALLRFVGQNAAGNFEELKFRCHSLLQVRKLGKLKCVNFIRTWCKYVRYSKDRMK